MKKSLYSILSAIAFSAVMSSTAQATVNTLELVDSYPTGSDTVCVFSDGRRTETWIRDGAGHCPSHMTFGSEDE